MQRFLKLSEVINKCTKSRSTIYSEIKAGKFPAPISIGARSVAWLSSDIETWMEARVKASRPDLN